MAIPRVVPQDFEGVRKVISELLIHLQVAQDKWSASTPSGSGDFIGQRVWSTTVTTGQPVCWVWSGTVWKSIGNFA